MVYRLKNHTGCWQNTRRICKSRAADERIAILDEVFVHYHFIIAFLLLKTFAGAVIVIPKWIEVTPQNQSQGNTVASLSV